MATIVFVARRFHSNQSVLLRELMRLGYGVHFFAEHVGQSENHSTIQPHLLGKRRLPWPPFREVMSRFAVFPRGSVGRVLSPGPDVVIIRDFFLGSLLMSLALRARGLRVIMYSQEQLDAQPYPSWRALLHRLFGSTVITPTRAVQGGNANGNRAGRSGPFGVQWHYLPFVATTDANKEAVHKLRQLKSGDRAVRILTVGKFLPRKRLPEWARLFADLRDQYGPATLTIVGAARKHELVWQVEESARSNPGVRVLLDVPQERMAEIYREHDLFVLPAIREFASVSVLEAMAHGLPVICSSRNGTACYIENGGNGYLFDEDDWQQSLSACVGRALTDRGRLADMGARSLELVRERHSIERWQEWLRGLGIEEHAGQPHKNAVDEAPE